MATKISQNKNLSGSHRQRSNVVDNFKAPFAKPAKAPAKKKKKRMRISPCDRMLVKYWYNDYAETRSVAPNSDLKYILETIDTHPAETLDSSATYDAIDGAFAAADDTLSSTSSSDGSRPCALIMVDTFRCIMLDTGFSMQCNYGPIDECQGIKASVVVYKTGVTEYWFYRRGFVSTIHYEHKNKVER